MHLLTSISRLFCIVLLVFSGSVWAENINALRSQATLSDNGQLSVSARFQTQLPTQLRTALQQGLPLTFELSYQLNSPTWVSYKLKFNQIINAPKPVQYKLSYHPITKSYRVSIGTLVTDYQNLDAALRSVGAIVNWRVLPSGTLDGYKTSDVSADVRLQLSTSQLPKPFQINAITSQRWNLDSGWVKLNVSAEE